MIYPVSFRTVGLNLLQRRMIERKNKLKQFRRFNAQAVALIDRWIQDNFQTEGKRAEGPRGWQPLSARTLAMRRKNGRAAKILQDTGALKSRWKHWYDDRSATIQSGVDYGKQHDEGIGVPKRKILPTQKQADVLIKKLLKEHIKGAIE